MTLSRRNRNHKSVCCKVLNNWFYSCLFKSLSHLQHSEIHFPFLWVQRNESKFSVCRGIWTFASPVCFLDIWETLLPAVQTTASCRMRKAGRGQMWHQKNNRSVVKGLRFLFRWVNWNFSVLNRRWFAKCEGTCLWVQPSGVWHNFELKANLGYTRRRKRRRKRSLRMRGNNWRREKRRRRKGSWGMRGNKWRRRGKMRRKEWNFSLKSWVNFSFGSNWSHPKLTTASSLHLCRGHHVLPLLE